MGYDRQIAYIDLITNGVKTGNAGFIKWETHDNEYKMEIHVKGLFPTDTITAEFRTKEGKHFETISIICGEGSYCLKGHERMVGRDQIPIGDLSELIAELPGNRRLEAQWMNRLPKEEPEITEKKKELKQEDIEYKEEPKESRKPYQSKWEQLCDMFDLIHPFGDDRVCIRITPDDFYLFRESCQHLSHNSFLLHGFYNYHYLILLRKENQPDSYFLGVPGVYHEREIMAAKMFGFEGFEGAQKQYGMGSFGYYMVSVE